MIHRTLRLHRVAALTFATALVAAYPQASDDGQKSVNDGVYSAAQADRGKAVFEKQCTMCHDTARFTGDTFLSAWTGQPLGSFFDVMRSSMPEDNPGSLKPQEYIDIVAFVLSLNRYPAGAADLPPTPDVLAGIAVVAPPAER